MCASGHPAAVWLGLAVLYYNYNMLFRNLQPKGGFYVESHHISLFHIPCVSGGEHGFPSRRRIYQVVTTKRRRLAYFSSI